MYHNTKLFQASPHCYCRCVVVFVPVVGGGYGGDGVVALDFADDDVVDSVIVIFF